MKKTGLIIASAGEDTSWLNDPFYKKYDIFLYNVGAVCQTHEWHDPLHKRIEVWGEKNNQQHFSFGGGGSEIQRLIKKFYDDKKYLNELYNILGDVLTNKTYIRGPQYSNIIPVKNCQNLRETNIWIRHVVENYEKGLNENLIFLQGWPFDHCENLQKQIFELSEMPCSINTIPGDSNSKRKHFFGDKMEKEASAFYKKLTGFSMPEEFQWACGAQFICKKSLILKKPISFYNRILDLGTNVAKSGEMMERFWIDLLTNPDIK